MLHVGSDVFALAVFTSPDDGALWLACAVEEEVRILAFSKRRTLSPQPVIDGDSECGRNALRGPATLALQIACGCSDGKVLVFDLAFDPVAGVEALVVLDVGSWVTALTVFEDQATGALPREDRRTAPCASGTWPRAARYCLCSRDAR